MAMEFLVATPAVRNLIRTGEIQQLYAAMESGSAEGMTTLNASLLYLFRQGHISREDAIQQSTQPKELIAALRSLSARCGRVAGDAPAGSFVGGRLCAGMRRAQDGL